jgi:hypothetical protein
MTVSRHRSARGATPAGDAGASPHLSLFFVFAFFSSLLKILPPSFLYRGTARLFDATSVDAAASNRKNEIERERALQAKENEENKRR